MIAHLRLTDYVTILASGYAINNQQSRYPIYRYVQTRCSWVILILSYLADIVGGSLFILSANPSQVYRLQRSNFCERNSLLSFAVSRLTFLAFEREYPPLLWRVRCRRAGGMRTMRLVDSDDCFAVFTK